jgi:hypothetical protein
MALLITPLVHDCVENEKSLVSTLLNEEGVKFGFNPPDTVLRLAARKTI